MRVAWGGFLLGAVRSNRYWSYPGFPFLRLCRATETASFILSELHFGCLSFVFAVLRKLQVLYYQRYTLDAFPSSLSCYGNCKFYIIRGTLWMPFLRLCRATETASFILSDVHFGCLSFVFAVLRKLRVLYYQRYTLDASTSTYTIVNYFSINEGMF